MTRDSSGTFEVRVGSIGTDANPKGKEEEAERGLDDTGAEEEVPTDTGRTDAVPCRRPVIDLGREVAVPPMEGEVGRPVERANAQDRTLTEAPGPGEPFDVEIGPIWSNEDAKWKAPQYIRQHPELEWTGHWHTTVWGRMSVIQVRRKAAAAPKEEVDRGLDGTGAVEVVSTEAPGTAKAYGADIGSIRSNEDATRKAAPCRRPVVLLGREVAVPPMEGEVGRPVERANAQDRTLTEAPGPGEPFDVEIGPIWSNEDAKWKAPQYIRQHPELEWTGHWHTTVWGRMSVIQVRRKAAAAPKEEVDRGLDGTGAVEVVSTEAPGTAEAYGADVGSIRSNEDAKRKAAPCRRPVVDLGREVAVPPMEGEVERPVERANAQDRTLTEAPGPGEPFDVEIGPIWSNEDAKRKAPQYIRQHPELEWTGHWHTTVWGKMSVIQVRRKAAAAPKEEVDRGLDGTGAVEVLTNSRRKVRSKRFKSFRRVFSQFVRDPMGRNASKKIT